MTDIAELAAKLTKMDKQIARALCGNAWDGEGTPSPGLARMETLGLMHIKALRRSDGTMTRYRAKPTPLGLALRAHLEQETEHRQEEG
jgi:hypothetical protein